MSDESQKDEIKDETHQLQDIEQEELEDDEADEFEEDEDDFEDWDAELDLDTTERTTLSLGVQIFLKYFDILRRTTNLHRLMLA